MKTMIVIVSDPKSGSEEAIGRVFNALAVAYEIKSAGDDVDILFLGTGTRWPEELQKENHPVHHLFKAVEDRIQGVSSGCADVFGSNTAGLNRLSDNLIPGTSGLPSLYRLQKQGYNLMIF